MVWPAAWVLLVALARPLYGASSDPCLVEMVADLQQGDPSCGGVYPPRVRVTGGERVMLALSNLQVPWYAKAGFDACPWNSFWRWRADDSAWRDPILPPEIEWVGSQRLQPVVKVLNRTVDPIDFRDVMHISEQRNNELLELHKDDTIILITMPASSSAGSAPYIPQIYWNKKQTVLGEQCAITMYNHPYQLSDVFPETAPAHGGTMITVMGDFGNVFQSHLPLVKFTAPDGFAVVVPALSKGWFDITCEAPPMVLNETDITMNVTVSISFSWQTWFEIKLNGNESYPVVYYDPSRIVCDQVISLESAVGLQLGAPHPVVSATGQSVTAIPKEAAGSQSLWIVKEAHGETPCRPGMPILCNQTVRFVSASTGQNLHATWEETAFTTTKAVTMNGRNGHGDKADNWVVQCEKNTHHPYALSLYDKVVGVTETGETLVQNFTWDQLPLDTEIHKRQLKWVLSENHKYWRPSTVISLLHEGTQRYLSVRNRTLNNQVVDSSAEAPLIAETVRAGVRRSSTRFYTSSVIDIPVDCGSVKTHDAMRLRFKRWIRPIEVGDFVTWQNNSGQLCENQGILHDGRHCEGCNYVVGRVWKMRPANVVELEIYDLRYPLASEFLSPELPQYTQTIERRNVTLLKQQLYGPIVHKLDGTSMGPQPPPPPVVEEGEEVTITTGEWYLDMTTGQWIPPGTTTIQTGGSPGAAVEDTGWDNTRINSLYQLPEYDYGVKFRQYAKLHVERIREFGSATQEQFPDHPYLEAY